MTVFAEDRELLARFRAGERDALERVYWAYVELVERVVRHGVRLVGGARVPGATADAVADLVQETFARAFSERARLAYDGLRPYRPFLLTICRNLLADWGRTRGRELTVDELPDPSDGAEAAGGAEAAEEPWAEPEVIAAVEEYLAGLDPRLRAVYDARYVRDLSQMEAAAALGLSRQQIGTLEDKLRHGL